MRIHFIVLEATVCAIAMEHKRENLCLFLEKYKNRKHYKHSEPLKSNSSSIMSFSINRAKLDAVYDTLVTDVTDYLSEQAIPSEVIAHVKEVSSHQN